MASKTRVVYKLDSDALSCYLMKQLSEISQAERLTFIKILMSTFGDAYRTSAGFSSMNGSGELYAVGFAVEASNPDALPAHYPSAEGWLKREA